MLRYFFSLVFVLGLNTFIAGAQTVTGSVAGAVLDSVTNEPVAMATVFIRQDPDGPVRYDITDRKGGFTIDNIEPGMKTLRVRMIGYAQHEQTMQIRPGETQRVRILMIEDAKTTEPVEIIGQSSEAIDDLTGAATMVEPRTLRQIKPIGTQELVEYVPGIHGVADDGIGNSRISIGIRGLNPRRSSHVLVLEDGIPIQPALYIYPNMYYNPPTERIDRVEVIKGSAAIRYGPQTMGGVINYVTRRPRQEFGALAQVTGGTHGFVSVLTEIGGWGSEAIAPELQLLYKRGEGYRQNNGFEQYNGTLKINIVPDAEKAIYLKANVNYENSNATYTGLTEYSFATDPTFNPKEHDNFKVFRASLDLLYTSLISSSLTSNTKAYINYFDRQWWREDDVFIKANQSGETAIQPVPYFEPGDLIRTGGGLENHGNLRSFRVLGVEHAYLLNHSLLGADSRLEVGARLHWDRFIDDRKKGYAPDARDGVYYTVDPTDSTISIVGQSHHYETTALALFASETFAFDALTVTPGVRFEVFEQERIDRLQGSIYLDKTSMVVLPGLGLNYDLGEMNIFAGVHRGYTPPSNGTLAIANFGANAAAGGIELESEKSWNMELGLRGAMPWLHFEVAGYLVEIEDLVAAGRGTTFKNLGGVRSWGAEVGGSLRASRLLDILPDVNLSYTYMRTKVTEGTIVSAVRAGNVLVDIAGRELPYAPHHTLTAGLAKEFDFGLMARFDAHYVGRVFTDFENIGRTYNRGDTGPVPAYTVLSASVDYRVDENWSASVAVKNLLDEIYIGSRLHSNPGQPEANLSSGIIPGPRRQINVGVTYRIGAQ